MMSASAPRVLLIVPCYNEASSIEQLLLEIAPLRYDAVVIDDGSSDDTCAVASRHVRCLRLVRNLGIGGAVQTGIIYAHRLGYDHCVQIDGDGQHPPGQVALLLQAWRRSPSNITIGSRYIENSTFRSTRARRFGSRVIATALQFLCGGVRITDPTSGMRLLDRRAIGYFAENYPHDFPEPISLAWAMRAGLTVGETAVEMRAREHGHSSIGGWDSFAYMVRVLGYIVLARLSRRSPG